MKIQAKKYKDTLIHWVLSLERMVEETIQNPILNRIKQKIKRNMLYQRPNS